jgi:hypothetical protein
LFRVWISLIIIFFLGLYRCSSRIAALGRSDQK